VQADPLGQQLGAGGGVEGGQDGVPLDRCLHGAAQAVGERRAGLSALALLTELAVCNSLQLYVHIPSFMSDCISCNILLLCRTHLIVTPPTPHPPTPQGWLHHLARHAVACFLTRGDLWQSWEAGQAVFEEYLVDGDHFLNAANWQWLSASAFFSQYYRVYSPVTFAKK
jgi:hypothetical protein